MSQFPYRQVHLDFHTYGQIPNIGKHFSKENFQAALKEAGLDSITVFAVRELGKVDRHLLAAVAVRSRVAEQHKV